ncbi:hypothetical protein BDQ12DRAFT_706791 [Crucibulum laeve]|uniref:Pyranose 2-oxidase n=1 Tax=Crucibulum laeve TaxID=68775 RepID=A0A5C3M1S2_9AGAR|nr:hypothetical protein BDQ12DRAFT_706791 [Crucibulum laeve]
MPFRLSIDDIYALLSKFIQSGQADDNGPVIFADVFIAGSGPVACAYARTILDERPKTKIYMAEIGSQEHPIRGAHQKNSVNITKSALQPVSIAADETYQTTLSRASWSPPITSDTVDLAMEGYNAQQDPRLNLRGTGMTRTVGGMGTHWTCACPTPHIEEAMHLERIIPRPELDILLERAATLLNVHSNEYDNSIRHTVVKEMLTKLLPAERSLANIPLAVERRIDNPDYVTWTGANTVLGHQIDKFKLLAETRVTRIFMWPQIPGMTMPRAMAALLRNMNTDEDVLVIAKAFVIACGAIGTPQILWNSHIRPSSLGKYLTEQSVAFSQVVFDRNIITSIEKDPRWAERIKTHKEKHPKDPLPIPFNDPEPQLVIRYTSNHPWHAQIHRDALSYGSVGTRFFGKSDLVEDNRVEFGDVSDIYGMPQPTFYVSRTDEDGKHDQQMMRDMTDIANTFGGFLPGSEPQFLEPGLAFHITGTTRLGSDHQTSVADANSLVHGTQNLWVGGNGCIPDATACNPTRTSVALAIKGALALCKYVDSVDQSEIMF